ncbi:unnamed protein product [Owenia fusiformis]|uniref:Uncharacterized protein n=1 Tax=Owenia fusiformis TaxID=6347 RepID=A0A8J1UDA5_OWEFU|nr:unnamed protein product [Owenia fusiformis]
MTTQYITTTQPVVAQPNVVVYNQSQVPGRSVSDRYNKKASNVVGILILMGGVLSFILGCVAIGIKASLYQSGVGLWCGVLFYGITGVLGILASKPTRNGQNGYITGFMVMCIITVSFACLVMLGITAAGVGMDDNYYGRSYRLNPEIWERNSIFTRISRDPQLAVNALLLAITLAEGILCIIGSSFGCAAVCCYTSSPGYVVQGRQTTVITQGQPATQAAYYPQGQTTTVIPPPGQQAQPQQYGQPQYGQPQPQYGQPQPQYGQPQPQYGQQQQYGQQPQYGQPQATGGPQPPPYNPDVKPDEKNPNGPPPSYNY